MSGKSSFPYRKYDRRPHPHIVKQILEDSELVEMMKEVLIQEGKTCPFCHRKLKKAEKETSRKAVEEELGDLLFTLVNWARFRGISAEEALRKANRRFARRFYQVEEGLRKKGKKLADSSLAEMDDLWNQAKQRAKSKKGRD